MEETFEQYLLHENFTPEIVLHKDLDNEYRTTFEYLCNEVLSNPEITKEDIIDNYFKNYNSFSELLFINEMFDIYNDSKELVLLEHDGAEYTEKEFEENGFIKSNFVIHEHDSQKAPLHWDLRFKTEFGTSAYSFVLLKHKLPENDDEKLLVKQQPMHPSKWVDLDKTVIEEGYGKGSIKTIDRGIIYYKIANDRSFSFYLDGSIYKGAYHLINIRNTLFLLFKARKNILSSKEEREKEWVDYAKKFMDYLSNTFYKKYGINEGIDCIIDDKHPKVLDRIEYHNMISTGDPGICYIPSIKYCTELRINNEIVNMKSADCKIRSIEDIMRLLILRNNIAPLFFKFINDAYGISIGDIYTDTIDIAYSDPELESIKNSEYINYANEKIKRMFADIFMGHKYYGQFDFELYLINKIEKNRKKKMGSM